MKQQHKTLRIAEALDKEFGFYLEASDAVAELRRLHAESEQHLQELRSYRITVENREARIAELEARVRELEASQERLPLSDERIDEMFNGRGQNSNHLSGFIREIVRETETEHGITQEKQ